MCFVRYLKNFKTMKKIFTPLLSLALVIGLLAEAQSQITWKVNTKQAKITYNETGSGAEGTFSGLEATIKFDPLKLSNSSITARIDAKSVTAKEEGQAADITSSEYLNVAKYPYIRFESTNIKKKGEKFELTGKLTMKGKTKEITVPFEFVKKNKTAVFKGKMTVAAKDFGMPVGDVFIDLEVPVDQK